MIEAIGLMVARIRAMILRGEDGVVSQLQAAAVRTGIDLAIGRTLDGESLLAIFMPPGSSVDPTNCMLFGEILYLDGLAFTSAGDHQSGHESFAKALLLLRAASSYATSAGIRFPDTEARVEELQRLLEGDAAEHA
jgi:hypothetical protein